MSSPDTGIDSSVDTGTSSADASSTDSAAPDSPVTGVSHVLYLVATPSGALGGIAGADALCNAHLPPGATSARALLVDNSARIACTTPDCSGGPSEHVDWPLLPNTRYTRPDGTLIATTNANGVFTSLNNPISTTLVEVWTGVQSSWIPIPPRCSDGTGSWTSASNSSFGGAGRANAPDIVGAFQGLAQFCDRNNVSLYCVVP